jgi:hypothetical protein
LIVAVVFVPTVVVLIVNEAERDPAGTVTDAGTVAAAFVLESVTTAPPAGAGPLSVTVALAVDVPKTVVGSRTTEYGTGVGETVKFAVFDAPALAAVITVAALVVTGREVIGNEAIVVPEATVTLAGTVARVVTELVSVTTVPPAGAAAFSVTVPVVPIPPRTLVWPRERVARSGVTVRFAVLLTAL